MPLDDLCRADSHRPLRVLVVDDDSMIRRILCTYLSQRHHLAASVATREEALSQLASSSFDVVVTDVLLPDGDGLDIVNYIANRRLGSRAVVVTGGGRYFGPEYFRRIAHALGACVLEKPFGRDDFVHAVETGAVPP